MGKKTQAAALIRSRIIGHGDVNPEDLLANPLNFRRHPGHQMDALRGSMKELGWLKTILVNKTTGHVLDGHARVEEAMRQGLKTIPATIVELAPEEERLALAVLDPITELATRDQATLDELLADVSTADAGLQALLDELAGKDGGGDGEPPEPEPELEEDQLAVAVPCADGAEQAEILARLTAMGLPARLARVNPDKRKKKGGSVAEDAHMTIQ